MKLFKRIKLNLKNRLKHIAKIIFKNHVYLAKHGLAKGFRVMGDLGFLTKPGLSHEDIFFMSLDLTGKTVYDIGSHIGITTLFFAKAVGETGRVISFEPNPESFAILRKNIKLNHFSNVTLANIGVGEKRDQQTLVYGAYNNALGSFDQTIQEDLLTNQRGIKVKTCQMDIYSIDEYIAEQNLPDPDFVKIDVEGFEYNVLLGMAETVRRSQPLLHVEIHGQNKAQRLENAQKIVQLLTSYQYQMEELLSKQLITTENFELVLNSRMLICRKHNNEASL